VSTTPIGLEIGSTWVFAAAVDWPGWSRRGKGEDAAIAALLEHADRYRWVAGPGFRAGRSEVVGRVDGNATTNFGAPGVRGPWDDERLDAAAPTVLPRAPRGGGRDRDDMAEHVREAERSYARRVGVRVPPRTPWTEQRDKITAALMEERAGPATTAWPPRYFIRRSAWHVLDHAWEMEDKSCR
jgi:hypothetical protein